MITLVLGGSKCGKSRVAEELLNRFNGKKFYVATMQPYGSEAHAAIERHRKMRSGKCFETIEKYTDIDELDLPYDCAVLLECMGNLCANEMFCDGDCSCPVNKIVSGIEMLSESVSELVIVSNDVGSDGIAYDEGTMKYIAAMGEINCRISSISDNVIECIYGIPVVLKGELT